jgi:hypothetical protein
MQSLEVKLSDDITTNNDGWTVLHCKQKNTNLQTPVTKTDLPFCFFSS